MTSAFRKPIPRPRQSKGQASALKTVDDEVVSPEQITCPIYADVSPSTSRGDANFAEYGELLDKPVPPPRRSKLSLPEYADSSTPEQHSSAANSDNEDSGDSTPNTPPTAFANPEYMHLSRLLQDSAADTPVRVPSNPLDPSELDFFDPLRQRNENVTPDCDEELQAADFEQLRLAFNELRDVGNCGEPDRVSNQDPALLDADDSGVSTSASGQSICYNGWLEAYSAKQQQHRWRWWCVLRDRTLRFMCSDDFEADTSCEFEISCSHIVYLSSDVDMADRKASTDQQCFVLMFRRVSSHPVQKLVLFTADEACRDVWLMLISKCIAQEIGAADYVEEVEQAGSVYIKQGTTSDWRIGWAFMAAKSLSYTFNESVCYQIDLRKVFEIKLSTQSIEQCNFVLSNQIGPIVISQKDSSVYLQTGTDAITRAWFKQLSKESLRLTKRLEDQRFTSDDVPHIVDKCIKFISLYGIQHEGIYRKAAQHSHVQTLMNEFQKDAAQVHLVYESEESINVVADVLRRFFRQLAEPLVTAQLRHKLYDIVRLADGDAKIAAYQQAVDELPHVNYVTLRLLLGHLKEITDQSAVNRATVINVAKVFAPTLFSTEQADEQLPTTAAAAATEHYRHTADEISAVHDLILFYNAVFRVTEQEALARAKVASPTQKKSTASGFLIPIHVFEKDNEAFNLEDSYTATEVLDFAIKHKQLDPNQSYAVFEVVNNASLERPLRPNEALKDVVVDRWYSWSDKTIISTCYFLIKRDNLVARLRKTIPNAYAGETRLADIGSKSFRKGRLECSRGQICHYKDSKKTTPQNKWNVEHIVWYLGHDSKRDPPFPHTVSMLDLTLPCQPGGKFFGICVCFREENAMMTWLATVSSLQGYWNTPDAQIQNGVKLIDT